MIRHCLLAVCLIILTGCGSMKINDFAGKEPEFRPEVYFIGKTYAYGFFQDRFGTIRRQFTVEIDGYMEDGELVLDEHFVYDDGELDQRVWRLEIGPNGTYTGRAGDVIGVATGQIAGNALRFQYVFELPVGGSLWKVDVDDWMLQQTETVMLNKSTVSKFGVKLGEIFISFGKEAPNATNETEEQSSTQGQPSSDKMHSPA